MRKHRRPLTCVRFLGICSYLSENATIGRRLNTQAGCVQRVYYQLKPKWLWRGAVAAAVR